MKKHRRGPHVVLIEDIAEGAVLDLEQYAQSVVDVSSKFNNSSTRTYSAECITGKAENYPYYGDFMNSYMLKSYGKSWRGSESDQKNYRPQDVDPFGAEDFITLRFAACVAPRLFFVYEIYNPGAIVRIWGRLTATRWKLFWEGEPELCPDRPRKFSQSMPRNNELINEIRLEFNHSHLRYYTAIDAVMLSGYCLPQHLNGTHNLDEWNAITAKCDVFGSLKKTEGKCTENRVEEEEEEHKNYFKILPDEVKILILRNLDLQSLRRCALVDSTWSNTMRDAELYRTLDLKSYWNKVDASTLRYYSRVCRNQLRKLDLSWCGFDNRNEFAAAFCDFITQNGVPHLTHLALNNCRFVNDASMQAVAQCTALVELRMGGLRDVDGSIFTHLTTLTNLVTLDVSSSKITHQVLISILKETPQLQHLNLDLCESIANLDPVVEVASQFNRNLRTWSSWKVLTLSSVGAAALGKCPELREINLGWCLSQRDPGNCLEYIASGCKLLKKLIIPQWQGINDQRLVMLSQCEHLMELDLSGICGFSGATCHIIISAMPNLRFLDVTFCEGPKRDLVIAWQMDFPNLRVCSDFDVTSRSL